MQSKLQSRVIIAVLSKHFSNREIATKALELFQLENPKNQKLSEAKREKKYLFKAKTLGNYSK